MREIKFTTYQILLNGVFKIRASSICSRHLEKSEGSTDRDFSPTAQNDEFLDTPYNQ